MCYVACGDYPQGVARIRCTNPECGLVSGCRRSPVHPGHDYVRSFYRPFYGCARDRPSHCSVRYMCIQHYLIVCARNRNTLGWDDRRYGLPGT